MRVNPCPDLGQILFFQFPFGRLPVSLTTWEKVRSHLTIFHNIVNITLNRLWYLMSTVNTSNTSWRSAILVNTSSIKWFVTFKNIVALSLSSILYLAVSLLCWAFPHMTHFRSSTRTELNGLPLAESEDLERDELNTKMLDQCYFLLYRLFYE